MKSFSVTRFSGFDGARVQITTARDSKKELDFTDKLFTAINLSRQEAIDLAQVLIQFGTGNEEETFDSVPLQVAEKQWKRDYTKTRPNTARTVKRDNGDVVVQRPSFTQLLVENQKKLSGNDKLYYDSRRTGTVFGTKFSEASNELNSLRQHELVEGQDV